MGTAALTNGPRQGTVGVRISEFGLRIFATAALLVAGLFVACDSAVGAEKNPNSACLECHSDKTLYKTNSAGKAIWLFVDEAKFATAVHRTNTCASCHTDITSKHPDDNVAAKPVNCAACHDEPAKQYTGSIHGVSHTLGASGAAGCVDCHGKHDILSAKAADSPVFKLNLPGTCATCHSNPGIRKPRRSTWTAFTGARC
jgi:hypothetical protein